MSRTLPHEQKFAEASDIDVWWDASDSIELANIDGKNYVKATSGNFQGQLGFDMRPLQEVYSPLADNTYTIKIVAGPYGFSKPSKVPFSMVFILQSLSSVSQNTITITTNPAGLVVTSTLDGQQITMFQNTGIPGSAILVSVASNSPVDTTTITVSFYEDDGLTTPLQQASYEFSLGATWVQSYPYITVGEVENDFMLAEVGVYLSPSCIAQGSLIETTSGLKSVETLSDKDMIYDARDRPTSIVKVWRTTVPLAQKCVRLGKVTVSENHMVRFNKEWRPAKTFGLGRSVQAYFYQIQTDSYGFRCDDYSIATWTKLYLETADTSGYE